MEREQIIRLIDLTSLTGNETESDLAVLCADAHTPFGNVAAVCVYPHFVSQVKARLRDIPVATVINFPTARDTYESCDRAINAAIQEGADEIDLVLPYHNLIAGKTDLVKTFLRGCREIVPKQSILKVIIESGELKSEALIRQASELAIESGANFVKTSTGKTAVGATPEAARIILDVIKNSGREVGIKLSGGIRTRESAESYLTLIAETMGEDWINPEHVRIGASSLINELY